MAELQVRCPFDGWLLSEPLHVLFPECNLSGISVTERTFTEAGTTSSHISPISVLDLKKRISMLRGGAPLTNLRLLYKGERLVDHQDLRALLREHKSEGKGDDPMLLYLLDTSKHGSSMKLSASNSPADTFVRTSPQFAAPATCYQSHLHNSGFLSPFGTARQFEFRPDERSLAAANAWLTSQSASSSPSVATTVAAAADVQSPIVLPSSSPNAHQSGSSRLESPNESQHRHNITSCLQQLTLRRRMRTGSSSSPGNSPGSSSNMSPRHSPQIAPQAAAAVPAQDVPVVRPPPGAPWMMLLRFALAVGVVAFDAPPAMQALYTTIGLAFYLYELRRLRREAAAPVAGAGARGNDAAPALPQQAQGIVGMWERLYAEGFPVPQSPGILLDVFSIVMALVASLLPRWDPRPVTPILRPQRADANEEAQGARA